MCPLHSQVHCSAMSFSSRSTSTVRAVSSPQPGSLFSDEFLLQVYVHRAGCVLSTARFTVQRWVSPPGLRPPRGVCPLHSQVHCSAMGFSSRSTSNARGVSSLQPGSLFSDEFLLPTGKNPLKLHGHFHSCVKIRHLQFIEFDPNFIPPDPGRKYV